MAKKFMTFLGAGKYKKCIYTMQGQNGIERSPEVKFVQTALISFLCKEFSPEDKIVFFLTDKAREECWETPEKKDNSPSFLEENSVYNNFLKEKGIDIVDVSIQDSKTEADVWGLFSVIFNQIEEGDEIYFDVTNGFRYLPMLFFSVLYYASFLKGCKARGVYYGAFEAKTSDDPPVEPIFNLIGAYEIMQWSNAADLFLNYGQADKIEEMVNLNAKDFIGSKSISGRFTDISKALNLIRGMEIDRAKVFSSAKKKIEGMKNSENTKLQEAFVPIVKKMEDKLELFKPDDKLNFYYAALWQFQNKQYPQSVTMLQEGIISLVLDMGGKPVIERELREALGAYFNKEQREKRGEIFSLDEKYEKDIKDIYSLLNEEFTRKITEIYEKLTTVRNDINHGGYRKVPASANKLIDNIGKIFEELKEFLKKEKLIAID